MVTSLHWTDWQKRKTPKYLVSIFKCEFIKYWSPIVKLRHPNILHCAVWIMQLLLKTFVHSCFSNFTMEPNIIWIYSICIWNFYTYNILIYFCQRYVAFYQWSKVCQIYSKIVGTRDFRGDVWLEEKQNKTKCC